MDRFDNLIAGISGHSAWKDALVQVADCAFICRAWLDTHTKDWTATDLLIMTKMVIDREDAIKLSEERNGDHE